jgi:hypothetical protein
VLEWSKKGRRDGQTRCGGIYGGLLAERLLGAVDDCRYDCRIRHSPLPLVPFLLNCPPSLLDISVQQHRRLCTLITRAGCPRTPGVPAGQPGVPLQKCLPKGGTVLPGMFH